MLSRTEAPFPQLVLSGALQWGNLKVQLLLGGKKEGEEKGLVFIKVRSRKIEFERESGQPVCVLDHTRQNDSVSGGTVWKLHLLS